MYKFIREDGDFKVEYTIANSDIDIYTIQENIETFLRACTFHPETIDSFFNEDVIRELKTEIQEQQEVLDVKQSFIEELTRQLESANTITVTGESGTIKLHNEETIDDGTGFDYKKGYEALLMEHNEDIQVYKDKIKKLEGIIELYETTLMEKNKSDKSW